MVSLNPQKLPGVLAGSEYSVSCVPEVGFGMLDENAIILPAKTLKFDISARNTPLLGMRTLYTTVEQHWVAQPGTMLDPPLSVLTFESVKGKVETTIAVAIVGFVGVCAFTCVDQHIVVNEIKMIRNEVYNDFMCQFLVKMMAQMKGSINAGQ